MTFSKLSYRVAWLALVAGLMMAAVPGPATGGESYLHLGTLRSHKPIRSFSEIRWAHTVRQRWDNSCGSAALSTILTHHYGDPTSEAVIIMAILRRTDPVKVKARGGFSLLDLKKFVESRGYVGKGYAGLSLKELEELGTPAIVPVVMRGYDHFVVFRGRRGSRVLLSDPAFGAVTMTTERFSGLWKGGIGFLVLGRTPDREPRGLDPQPEEFLMPDGGSIARTAIDLRPTPLTRR
jgi:hypothetical protein